MTPECFQILNNARKIFSDNITLMFPAKDQIIQADIKIISWYNEISNTLNSTLEKFPFYLKSRFKKFALSLKSPLKKLTPVSILYDR